MGNSLTHEGLVENLNTKFQVSVEDASIIDLDLTEVSELNLAGNQEQFSILFRGPGDRFLGQGIRSLAHEILGQTEVFLVPVRQDAEGFYYEAVFNRFRK